MGIEAEDLIEEKNDLSDEHLNPFLYPSNREIESVGVRGIYLGNFIPWDTKAQHESMLDEYGYKTRKLLRTFDWYNDVDSHIYSGIHDWIKFLRHGYGKATDHACREIRWGRIDRKQGENLAKVYRSIIPRKKEIVNFVKWLGMDEMAFMELVRQHSRFEFQSKTGTKSFFGKLPRNSSLRSHPYSGEYQGKEDYLLIGKCYPGY